MNQSFFSNYRLFSSKKAGTLVSKSTTLTGKKGFTLVEMLVTMSLVTILLLGVSSLFMTFLLSSTRTTVIRSLKGEGSEIISRLEFTLRNAQAVNWHGTTNSITCTANGTTTVLDTALGFDIIDVNDASTHMIMNSSNQIEIEDVAVNSGSTTASAPVFTCYKDANTQKISIKVTFTLSAKANSNIKQDFTTFVQLRNS